MVMINSLQVQKFGSEHWRYMSILTLRALDLLPFTDDLCSVCHAEQIGVRENVSLFVLHLYELYSSGLHSIKILSVLKLLLSDLYTAK
jgi:hypothetical protein